MGTFDFRIFGNDAALDWVTKFIERKSMAKLFRTLCGGLSDDDLAEEALAAAEVVAAINGYPSSDFPSELMAWSLSSKRELSNTLLATSQALVKRVTTGGALKDAWQEGNDFDSWRQVLEDLADRLQKPRDLLTSKPKPPPKPRAKFLLGLTSHRKGGIDATNYYDIRETGLPPKLNRCHSVDIDLGSDVTLEELQTIGGMLEQFPALSVHLSDLQRGRGFRLKDEMLFPFQKAHKIIIHLESLKEISRFIAFPNLTHAHFSLMQKVSDWERLGECSSLVALGLFGINSLTDLSFLQSLTSLKKLTLGNLVNLKDCHFLAEMPCLQLLEWELGPEIAVPPFRQMPGLKCVSGASDLPFLHALSKAPALTDIYLYSREKTKAEDFLCLKGHPNLKRIGIWGFRWQAISAEVMALLGLEKTDPQSWSIS